MHTEKDQSAGSKEPKQPQQEPVQNINLNDYAGDAEDEKMAREQATNYIEDVEHKNTDKPTTEE